MAIELDQISRTTLNRFALKCGLSLLIPLLGKTNYLLSVFYCLQFYTVMMVVIAIVLRQRYSARSFNHWSEALWLAFAAAGVRLLSNLIA